MVERRIGDMRHSPISPVSVMLGIEPLLVFLLLPFQAAFWVAVAIMVTNRVVETRYSVPNGFSRRYLVLLVWSLWCILFLGIALALHTPSLIAIADGLVVDWFKVVLITKALSLCWMFLLVWRFAALSIETVEASKRDCHGPSSLDNRRE